MCFHFNYLFINKQRFLLAYLHHSHDGTLRHGTLLKWIFKCKATFNVYVPQDLDKCPWVAVICKNPHHHPAPAPLRTPPAIVAVFREILLDMNWQLADAMPHHIMLDSGFMQGLQQAVGWSSMQSSPALSELHPSLANLDHICHLIDTLQVEKYPEGTSFKGNGCVCNLMKNEVENGRCYVCCAESHILSNRSTFDLIICMSPAMSLQLLQAVQFSIDTSFKHLCAWQEFKIESWDHQHMHSVVSACTFTTSQSAEAHHILFRCIFEIAQQDTNLPVKFHHIHKCGIEAVIADGHKGQGLGLGRYCVELCQGMEDFCSIEHDHWLKDLDPYDQLKRFYRLCVIHFLRNLVPLWNAVTPEVYGAMLSLSSFEAQSDLEMTLRTIQTGGRKAKAWLKDKIMGTKFALPALYFPKSLIPCDIWKACPTTTNSNEQSHRNINCDGTSLTVLGGIMCTRDYDDRMDASINMHAIYGIHPRDSATTHTHHISQSISRQGKVVY
ncbi:hypothetical protein J3A83DRAFT_4167974 [Scleroderma citrinum]